MEQELEQQIQATEQAFCSRRNWLLEQQGFINLMTKELHTLFTITTAALWKEKFHFLAENMVFKLQQSYDSVVSGFQNCLTNRSCQNHSVICWKLWARADAIRNLRQVYLNQPGGKMRQLQISGIQAKIEKLLFDLRTVGHIYNDIATKLETLLQSIANTSTAESCRFFFHSKISSLFPKCVIQKLLCDTEKQIIERLMLFVECQPSPVIAKAKVFDGFGSGLKLKKTKLSSQTSVSFQLFNLSGLVAQQHKLILNLILVNKDVAKALSKNGVQGEIPTETQLHCGDSKVRSINNGEALCAVLKYNEKDCTFSASFSNVSILKLNAGDRINARKKVFNIYTEQYYFIGLICLPYSCDIPGVEPFITVFTHSKPVIVYTGLDGKFSLPETESWATHFSSTIENFTELSTTASVDEIGNALRSHFTKCTNGIELKSRHENVLKNIFIEDLSKRFLLDTKVIREAIPLEHFYLENFYNQNYSFFTWFHNAAKMLESKYLQELYLQDCFEAFISRDEGEMLLTRAHGIKSKGDFILRFSLSNLSEIGALFVTPAGDCVVYVFKLDGKTNKLMKKSMLENIYYKLTTGEDAFANLCQMSGFLAKELAFPSDA